MLSIFLSHSHKDKPFARRLSDRLKAHGMHTWIDEAEMHVGDSLISKIESGIRESRYLGVVLSPQSASSEWVRKEVNIALTEEIQGKRIKVLPLLYQKCELPSFLTDKIYADFTEEFEEGFDKLLRRLTADLHDEGHKRKRADEILNASYQDWISFSKQDYYLLDNGKAMLILEYGSELQLSSDVLEYTFCSLCHLASSGILNFPLLKNWLKEVVPIDDIELFSRLMNNSDPQIRLGATRIAQHLKWKNVAATFVSSLKSEKLPWIKRASLQCISSLDEPLPLDLATSLLETDSDWLIQSYALKQVKGHKPCLLISDGTDFAAELGIMAQEVGYRLTSFTSSFLSREIEESEYQVLIPYELIILVRGEHFSQAGNEEFYSKLRRFVSQGGRLFATSWVSWENKYHKEFSDVLPFAHIRDTYNEDVTVDCKAAENQLAAELFPDNLSYRTSFELLRPKESSIVLLETDFGIPIFGYRKFGTGLCYYLNTCQHYCLGHMRSPLQTSSQFNESLKRVFKWISTQGNSEKINVT